MTQKLVSRTAMRIKCWTLKNRFEPCSAWCSEPWQSSITMHRFGGSMHAPMSDTTFLWRSLLHTPFFSFHEVRAIRNCRDERKSFLSDLITRSSSMNSCLSAASTLGSN